MCVSFCSSSYFILLLRYWVYDMPWLHHGILSISFTCGYLTQCNTIATFPECVCLLGGILEDKAFCLPTKLLLISHMSDSLGIFLWCHLELRVRKILYTHNTWIHSAILLPFPKFQTTEAQFFFISYIKYLFWILFFILRI